jgi:hypothetical protein
VTTPSVLMMEAARTSQTSVDIQLRTRQYIPEDSELHTRRSENLKSHKRLLFNIINATVLLKTHTHTKITQETNTPAFISKI